MNAFEVLGLILVVMIGARLWRDHQRREEAERQDGPATDTRLLVEEVARLRERVQVLERVVTDQHGASDLERRIERLRDPQESDR